MTFRSRHDTIIKFKMIRINSEIKKEFAENLHNNSGMSRKLFGLNWVPLDIPELSCKFSANYFIIS